MKNFTEFIGYGYCVFAYLMLIILTIGYYKNPKEDAEEK
jgi:uncharacterized membrane protein YkvI